ncbi:hypothetical protein FS935_00220 [Metabacillus litoralis]|uniref:Lipoprotein YvcA n=1 Tax=Metabacillus litoralis TaxID=152268 RepID=A0A5C6W5J5_9BACI|nr:hypothetical protein [Metabacillus litoralis]TXC92674.1 hypothetical protein FS935_00220 [Metabacillus litoralis]
MKKEVDREELPNTAAFQDEFTRSLLDSPEEVEDGYYLYKSKTGGYSMLWPKNAVTDGPPFYQKTKDSFEKIIFYDRNEDENYRYSFSTTYSTYGESIIDSSLGILSDSVGYDGEYEKIETEKTRIYYAKSEEPLEHSTAYLYFCYILSKESQEGLEYVFTAQCLDKSKTNCDINIKKEEEKALHYMKKVKFNIDE